MDKTTQGLKSQENKTALELAIEKLRAKKSAISDTKAIDRNRKGAYVDAIVLLIELLPTEKQQIVDAVTYGNRQDAYDGTETLGETYYNETFNKEK